MSGSIRKALGPVRKRLTDHLAIKLPTIGVGDILAAAERDQLLQHLEDYKRTLGTRREALEKLHHQLLTGDFSAEQDEVDKTVEQNQTCLFKCEDTFDEVSSTIAKLQQQKEQSLQREREERVQRDARQPFQGHALYGLQPPDGRTTVKLPKLDLVKFDGNLLQWQKFWDCFQASIHENRNLSAIDKMNYLKAQLLGDAKRALEGLAATNDNYEAAVNILKTRFGDKGKVLDAHYTALMNLSMAPSHMKGLRNLVDTVEQHLHSLEALGENMNQHFLLLVLQSKLPSDVLVQLTENNSGKIQEVDTLRKLLLDYLTTREVVENYEIA